jgi:hypothetical protein
MILSIDIGIKNLSLCCINYDNKTDMQSYKIELWNVYDTLDTEDHFCKGLKKNGDLCGKRCAYKYSSTLQSTDIIGKGTLQSTDIIGKGTLPSIVFCCKTHFPKTLLPLKKENHFKKRLINDYLLQDIAKIVLTKLQDVYNNNIDIFHQITNIVIELQPKINQKMKFISHIIYGKLVELYYNTSTTIRFVRASQKLKAYTGPILECKLKGTYAKRKWLSIQYARWFLENRFSESQRSIWIPHFENHNKKDDISDTFLMCINAIYGIPKKQTTDKNGKCIK